MEENKPVQEIDFNLRVLPKRIPWYHRLADICLFNCVRIV